MAFSDRKLLVLKAIVDFYTATGEPVGSKAVCENLDFSVSSATVRNDMAELTESGLILQPHTSAGRIPSEKGYRLYVDKLLDACSLDDNFKYIVDNALLKASEEPEAILKAVTKLLAELTGGIALASTPLSEDVRVYKLCFVQTSRHCAMMVLITSSGLIKTRIFRCEYVITKEILSIFESLLNDKLAGLPLDNISPAFIQSLAVSMGEIGILMSNVLWSLLKASQNAQEATIFTSGEVRALFSADYTEKNAQNLSLLIGDTEKLARFLYSCEGAVLIGSQSGINELYQSSVFTARYKINSDTFGMLALITPIRCDYPSIIPLLNYAAEQVGKLISALSNGSEEDISQ